MVVKLLLKICIEHFTVKNILFAIAIIVHLSDMGIKSCFDSTINANLCLENKILGIDLNMVYTSPQSNSIVGITPQSQQYPCICHNTNDFLTNAVTEETLDGEFMEMTRR